MPEETIAERKENNVIARREKNTVTEKPFTEFNKVFISGQIESDFTYSHETFWEKFYQTRVRVLRNSGTEDFIPIIISNLLLGEKNLQKSLKDKWIEVAGQFRSRNYLGTDGYRHLELFLFVNAINIYDNEDELDESTNANLIYLDGYMCKPPIFRITPLGREIADLTIAVNRAYGKSDYLPCICWGRVAQWANQLNVGTRVKLYGRIQSREYFKKFTPDSNAGEYRNAYEISIMRMQEIETLKLES